jgi:hypothetical protein
VPIGNFNLFDKKGGAKKLLTKSAWLLNIILGVFCQKKKKKKKKLEK